MSERRTAARAMAANAVRRGEPLAWFEELYAAAHAGEAAVPWADLEANPQLVSWHFKHLAPGARVLVVGCGLGDDAEWLAARGYEVTAFDISSTAVEVCNARFPETAVLYRQADLLALPVEWVAEPFDLVVEIYTVQVLPPGSPERHAAFAALASVTGGTLLAIARGRDDEEDMGAMPWPLTRAEMDRYREHGLTEVEFEDLMDDEDPPVRRFRAVYVNANAAPA